MVDVRAIHGQIVMGRPLRRESSQSRRIRAVSSGSTGHNGPRMKILPEPDARYGTSPAIAGFHGMSTAVTPAMLAG